jgi:hypothetical protein
MNFPQGINPNLFGHDKRFSSSVQVRRHAATVYGHYSEALDRRQKVRSSFSPFPIANVEFSP